MKMVTRYWDTNDWGALIAHEVPASISKRLKFKKRLPAVGRFAAVTYPPFGVYIRQEWWDKATVHRRERLLFHEGVHWEQMHRFGGPLFGYVRYVVLWMRHGYDNHPYEIEAYERASEFRP